MVAAGGKISGMCGRYSLELKSQKIVEAFQLAENIAFSARYNIAPTQPAPVVRHDAETTGRRLETIRWGLTPPWSKGRRPIINARSETIAEKPSFREAFRQRRCLVPATGFFEWQKLGKATQPFCIRRRDRAVFALAGIWDRFRDDDGNPVEAFAILTTGPNKTMSPVHDRMPVILDATDYSTWLEPALETITPLETLLVPAADDLLVAYPISNRVNSPANDDPSCVEPLAETRAE
jgi:putative SOS response-associated peptidase YedK